MTFEQKSTLAMTLILALVFSGYFALVLREATQSPVQSITYQGLMIPAVIFTIVLSIASHAVIAALAPSEAGASDERDGLIVLTGDRVGSYVLAAGTATGLMLVMLDMQSFWVAQVLLGSLWLAELSKGATKLALYRRGS